MTPNTPLEGGLREALLKVLPGPSEYFYVEHRGGGNNYRGPELRFVIDRRGKPVEGKVSYENEDVFEWIKKLAALAASEQPATEPLLIRCHDCGGTLIYKATAEGYEVYHSCKDGKQVREMLEAAAQPATPGKERLTEEQVERAMSLNPKATALTYKEQRKIITDRLNTALAPESPQPATLGKLREAPEAIAERFIDGLSHLAYLHRGNVKRMKREVADLLTEDRRNAALAAESPQPTTPGKGQYCKCGHIFRDHSVVRNGYCMVGGCSCTQFALAAESRQPAALQQQVEALPVREALVKGKHILTQRASDLRGTRCLTMAEVTEGLDCLSVLVELLSQAQVSGAKEEIARVLDDSLEELRELSEKATAGPWAWDNRGEKCDDAQIGVALNDKDAYYVGEITDSVEMVVYTDDVAQVTSGSADAAFIVACVNEIRRQLAALASNRAGKPEEG